VWVTDRLLLCCVLATDGVRSHPQFTSYPPTTQYNNGDSWSQFAVPSTFNDVDRPLTTQSVWKGWPVVTCSVRTSQTAAVNARTASAYNGDLKSLSEAASQPVVRQSAFPTRQLPNAMKLEEKLYM